MSDSNIENKGKNIPGNDDIDDFSNIQKEHKQEEPEAVVAQAETVKSRKPKPTKIICAVAAVVAVVVIAMAVYGASVPQDRILKGIAVGDIDVSGLDKGDALAVLGEKAGPFIKSEVVIVANGKSFVIRTEDIDAVLDVPATVDKAYSVGKSGNVFANALSALKFKISGGNFMPVITYNDEKLAAEINKIGIEAVGSQLVEHSVRFDESGKAYAVPGKSGYNNDPTKVMAMIKAALLEADSNEITVEFEKTKPAALTIDALDAYMYKNPVNASFVLENGDVKIVEAEDGRYIDKNECKKLVSKVTEGGPEVEIPYSTTEAEVKAEDLKGKLFNAELASYTTRYAPGGNRGSNVAIAASKINGKILLPGETFSFNGTVGKRTVANGFKPAPEYQNGQTVTGIGGGTCQVSTTVYSAALYADLKIVKRSNHSMSVSYVPLGQDATVTDGGIDLKFMNDTEYPIKISAVTGGGRITVTITGTAPEPAKTVKISHKSSEGGIRTTRYVYDAGGKLIKEEDMGMSKYKPHEAESEAPTSSATAQPIETAPTEAPAETTQAPSGEEPSSSEQTPTQAPTVEAPVSTPQPAVTSKPESPDNSTPIKTDDE